MNLSNQIKNTIASITLAATVLSCDNTNTMLVKTLEWNKSTILNVHVPEETIEMYKVWDQVAVDIVELASNEDWHILYENPRLKLKTFGPHDNDEEFVSTAVISWSWISSDNRHKAWRGNDQNRKFNTLVHDTVVKTIQAVVIENDEYDDNGKTTPAKKD